MAVQGLLEFWPCKNVNKLISGCLLSSNLHAQQKILILIQFHKRLYDFYILNGGLLIHAILNKITFMRCNRIIQMLPIKFISFAEVCVTYQRRIFNFSNRATLHEACQNHNFLLCILVPCMYEVLQLLLFGTKKINRGSFTLFLQNKQNTVFNFLNNLARMAVFLYTGCPRKIDTVKFDDFTIEGKISTKYLFMELKTDYQATQMQHHFLHNIFHV